jgi:hypothetical protein
MGGSYQRELVQFPGAPNPAFVYHPDGVDPETRQPVASATTDDEDEVDAPQASAVSTPTTVAANASSVKKVVEDEACLYVPGKFVRLLGLNIGDEAYMSVNNSSIVILPPRPQTICCGRKLHVDLRGNLRVSSGFLRKAGISNNICVKCDGSQIEVLAS